MRAWSCWAAPALSSLPLLSLLGRSRRHVSCCSPSSPGGRVSFREAEPLAPGPRASGPGGLHWFISLAGGHGQAAHRTSSWVLLGRSQPREQCCREGPWQLGPPHPKHLVPPTGSPSQCQAHGHWPLPWWDSPVGPSRSGAPEGSGGVGLKPGHTSARLLPPPPAPVTPSIVQGPVSGSAPGLDVRRVVFGARSFPVADAVCRAVRVTLSGSPPRAPRWLPREAAIAQPGRGSPHGTSHTRHAASCLRLAGAGGHKPEPVGRRGPDTLHPRRGRPS